MNYRSVLLLLSLFVAVVSSQSACDSAGDALLADPTCYNAFLNIRQALNNNTTVQEDLYEYCRPSCRNIVTAAATCSGNNDMLQFLGVNRIICSINENSVSCLDYIRSPETISLRDTLESSGACEDELSAGGNSTACSRACQEALQAIIIEYGCCIAEFYEYFSQYNVDALEGIRNLQCPVDFSRAGTCVQIGGANGLKAFGSVLLFAVMIVFAAF